MEGGGGSRNTAKHRETHSFSHSRSSGDNFLLCSSVLFFSHIFVLTRVYKISSSSFLLFLLQRCFLFSFSFHVLFDKIFLCR